MTNTSRISFDIELDANHVPEKITWDASDRPEDLATDTKSISIAIWDSSERNTLRMDLWTKDMPVQDMKRFYIECIGGLAQSALRATGDEHMASEMNALCDRLVNHLKKELQ